SCHAPRSRASTLRAPARALERPRGSRAPRGPRPRRSRRPLHLRSARRDARAGTRGRASAAPRSPTRPPATAAPAAGPGLRAAKHELAQRLRATVEEYLGQAGRRHHAERVTVATRILGRDQPFLAGNAHHKRTPLLDERRSKLAVVLVRAQVAAQAQLVVELV